jgi:phage terminase small subunit
VAARASVLEELSPKRHEITVDRIFAEYSKLGFQDIRKAFNENVSMKPLHEIDGDTSAAIAGFEIEETYLGTGDDRRVIARVKKVKLSERRAALDSMAKCMGLFVDRVEHTGKDGNANRNPGCKANSPPRSCIGPCHRQSR